jgi:tetratricopeptide (TPR) repeat protein
MDADEDGEARLKHASHYKDVLSTANQLYGKGGENVLTGLRLFDLEMENIRAGRAWVSTNSEEVDYLELCNEYPNAGHRILPLRLLPGERIKWLESGLKAARSLENREYEGYHLGNLGVAHRNLGKARKAIEYFEQSLTIARDIGDRQGEAGALGNLGNAYADLGETRKAIEYHEKSLTIRREIGDRQGEGGVLNNLGRGYYRLGDVRKAIEYFGKSLTIRREIGGRRGEGISLNNLGLAYYRLGDIRKAIGYYEQSLAIKRQIRDRRGEGITLFNMGLVWSDLKDNKDRAVDLMKQALEIFEATESPMAEQAREKLKEWGALGKDEE